MKKINKKTGIVIRKSSDKTILVETQLTKTHPIYEKKYQKKLRYLVSDPDNIAVVGDEVVIIERSPVSKRKKWEISKSSSAHKRIS